MGGIDEKGVLPVPALNENNKLVIDPVNLLESLGSGGLITSSTDASVRSQTTPKDALSPTAKV